MLYWSCLFSSEDEKQYNEIDVFLHGTPKQQKKALQRLAGNLLIYFFIVENKPSSLLVTFWEKH